MEYKYSIALKRRKTTTLGAFTNGDEVIMMEDSSESASNSEDIMVGKNNEFQMVKKMLIEHPSRQREIVSIKGMGGIGKTTLAKRLYDDPSIASHFNKRAWVVASQHHNKTHMLTDILESIGYVDCDTTKDIEEKVYQCLMHQRYFIVIDDIWSDKAWDAIKICFLDNENRSRILLTTRFADVAICIGSRKHFSHQMHLLDQCESWSLFHEKACKSRSVKFEKIGRPIVEKCKGLPLAIVVVVGLFSKLNEIYE
ncbi:PREDICTED: disease resistance protein RPP13-like [Ipomoea nil]|uniref:disease resistance protein RPP13-like n=1 Tax=Ipomoea nil TaxID=35883 RepID=UPI00090179A7|nr:PREDICTED: disease resistance protein RPP13-like [Ipomoea nil]